MRYGVLAWLCLMAAIAYIPRNYIGVAKEATQTELRLSDAQMGWVMSAFFITYALAQVPGGWLSHVWETRRALPLFALLWSILTGAAAIAAGFPTFLLTRLGMGTAQAGIFPAATNTIAHWFPVRQRALANGFLGSFMQIGGALTAMLTGLLLSVMSLNWLLLLYALPGIIWGIWFFVWFRDLPAEHPGVNAAELDLIGEDAESGSAARVNTHPEPTPWRALFTSLPMLFICGQQFFRAGGYMFYTSWFTTFLQDKGSITIAEAGLLTSLPIWAYVLGSLFGGVVADWIWVRTKSRRLSRQWLSVVSQLACAGLIFLAYLAADIRLLVFTITAGSFCAAIGGPCAYTITIDMGGKHVAPVFSTMNMSGNLGAAVFPVVVGWLVGRTGNWDLVLFLFAGIYVAAAVCWVPLNPNGTIFDEKKGAQLE
jgi:MFS family permease